MFLVVLGHMSISGKVAYAATEWIFSFHMPLFVYISGYFTKFTDRKKYLSGILEFAETLIVFTIIHVAIIYMQGQHLSVRELFLCPRWTLWYLLSLIWWRLMLYFTPSTIRDNHMILIIASIVLCLTMGWVPLGFTLSFQRTFAFLPFFTMGYVAGRKKVGINTKGVYLKFTFLVAIALFFLISPISLTGSFFQCFSYYNGQFSSPYYNFVFRLGWLFFAWCMSYCFLSIVPRKEYSWTHFGQLTLFIYMYHAVTLYWRFIFIDELNLPTNFPYWILYTVIVMGIIWLMSKVRFFHWLLNPISSLLKK